MSVDEPVDVSIDLDVDDNSVRAVVTERREIEIDDATVYYRVNYLRDENGWVDRVICGTQAAREAVRQHIRDPLAGGAGTFRRGCSPP